MISLLNKDPLIFTKMENYLKANFERKAGVTELQSKPFLLILDPSNHCNLRCPECAIVLGKDEWTQGFLPFELFEKLIDYYGPYAIRLMLYNFGESFLNKNIYEMIAHAKKYKLEVAMSSNVHYVDAKKLVASGLDSMVLSIDGATQDTYAKYRVRGDLSRVLTNVKDIVAEKRRQNSGNPILIWQYLIFDHNKHELEEAAQMAEELGVDEFVADIGQVNSSASVIKKYTLERSANIPCSLTTTENSSQHNSPRSSTRPPEKICKWLWSGLSISPVGKIFPCNVLFQDHLSFGTIDRKPVARLYNVDSMIRARQYFSLQDESDTQHRSVCATCTVYDKSYPLSATQIYNYFKRVSDFPDRVCKALAEDLDTPLESTLWNQLNELQTMQTKLSIVDFSPQGTIVGKGFNLQSNGEAAMWLITENATQTTTVVFNGTELHTTYGNSNLITTIVPRQYYQTAGTYDLYLRDLLNQRTSNVVRFATSI